MAGMEARIAALFSLLAGILLVHTLLLQPPCLVTDRLLSALDLRFDGRRLVELLNRRNMILLCNAILLLILVDAGLLTAPARRRRSSAATAASAAAGDCSLVLQKSRAADDASHTKSATVADGGRFKRQHRGRELAKATARVRRRLPLTRAAPREDAAKIQEIDLLDKQSTESCSNLDHSDGEEIAVVDDKSARFHFEPIAGDERSRAEEGTEAECAGDVDEMNKRFDEFIARTRRKMQLESMQLVKV